MARSQGPRQFQAIHIGHQDAGYDQIELRRIQLLECGPAVVAHGYVIAETQKHGRESSADGSALVSQQDGGTVFRRDVRASQS